MAACVAGGAGSSSGSGSGDGSKRPLVPLGMLPTGYYFQPRNEEVLVYLKRKILSQPLPVDIIPIADVYGTPPHRLPFASCRYVRGKEWYFFTVKPTHELAIEAGYWVRDENAELIHVNGKVEGFKQGLAFYHGPVGYGDITPWRISEYMMNPDAIGSPQQLSDELKEKIACFVLCKVYLEKAPKPSRKRKGH